MVAIQFWCHIDINNIAVLQLLLVTGYPVTDYMVDRRAYRLRKTLVVERGGYCLLMHYSEFVTDSIQFGSGHPGFDVLLNHFELLSGQLSDSAHFVDFFWCFDVDHWDSCDVAQLADYTRSDLDL